MRTFQHEQTTHKLGNFQYLSWTSRQRHFVINPPFSSIFPLSVRPTLSASSPFNLSDQGVPAPFLNLRRNWRHRLLLASSLSLSLRLTVRLIAGHLAFNRPTSSQNHSDSGLISYILRERQILRRWCKIFRRRM